MVFKALINMIGALLFFVIILINVTLDKNGKTNK